MCLCRCNGAVPAEASVHPDVRGPDRGRGQLRVPVSGWNTGVFQLAYVCRLMVSGLLGTQDGPVSIWCTCSASHETHGPSPTAFTAHPTRNVWRFSLSETLFQSATLKRLCHFSCRNVASLLYAVGEQTLVAGFVLVCEMQSWSRVWVFLLIVPSLQCEHMIAFKKKYFSKNILCHKNQLSFKSHLHHAV